MKNQRNIYIFKHKFSAGVMIIVLLWLTMCLPIVSSAYQNLNNAPTELVDINDDDTNPLTGNTDEKAPNTMAEEEMLHHLEIASFEFNDDLVHLANHCCKPYVAFHGELLCPPPNFLS